MKPARVNPKLGFLTPPDPARGIEPGDDLLLPLAHVGCPRLVEAVADKVGRVDAAEHVRLGVFAAIETIGGAPELFAAGPGGPEPIPIANRVQAWTVGARWALGRELDGRVAGLFDLP